MIDTVLERYGNKDPSLMLAIASVIRCKLDGVAPIFSNVAVAYRNDHLQLERAEFGESGEGALSVDQVRQHLEHSVFPRLESENVLNSLPVPLTGDSEIVFHPDFVAEIGPDMGEIRDALFSLALSRVREVETEGGPVDQTFLENPSVLKGEGLTKVYRRRTVVDSVDVSLAQGEIVGLLGPNGAGKTTTFYMIVGLVRPDGGKISLDGKGISGLPMYKRAQMGIGYLSQEPSIFRKLTVEENVMAILETLPISKNERAERLETLLDELSIKHLRTVPAYKLSGGERRRLEITRALVTEPKFMLLDEPFAGVDPIAVHDIQTIVAGLRKRGIGVLITDHNVEQTLDIVDRAYIMFEGKVQVGGSVRELVLDDRVAAMYLGPTLTARLRERLVSAV